MLQDAADFVHRANIVKGDLYEIAANLNDKRLNASRSPHLFLLAYGTCFESKKKKGRYISAKEL